MNTNYNDQQKIQNIFNSINNDAQLKALHNRIQHEFNTNTTTAILFTNGEMKFTYSDNFNKVISGLYGLIEERQQKIISFYNYGSL